MTNQDTDLILQAAVDDEPRNPWRGKAALLVGTLALGVSIGMVISQNSPEAREPNNNDKFGAPNPYISSLTIKEGAEVRYDPFVIDEADGKTNRILTIDSPRTVTIINGIDKIYTASPDESGKWFGITASSVPDLGIDDDNDGVVWIRERDASVEYEDQ